jgi:hypothetical protein
MAKKTATNHEAHICTVTPTEPETEYRDGAYRIDCADCGEFATYQGFRFTEVEARRHEAWGRNISEGA